jgi:hypothetical protein
MRKYMLVLAVFSMLLNPFMVYADTVPGSVVISAVQITGGTGQTQEDFVELFNPGSAPFNLNGHRLVKRSATGTTDSLIKSWTEDTFIEPHSFFLWANSGFTEITIVPDLVSSATLADNNGVALRFGPSDTGLIVDSISWGNAANGFQNVSTDNPGADLSILRQDLLGTNSVFAIGPSQPRNSSIFFGDPPPPALFDNAMCQSVVVATEVVTGSMFNVRVTFANNGSSTWLNDGSFGLRQSLSSESTILQQNVLPGENTSFDISLTAPSTAQVLTDSWQMSKSGTLFGEACGISVNVIEPTPPPVPDPIKSQLVKISEILPNPTGADPGNEIVELFSSDPNPVSLLGWYLDDQATAGVIGDSAYKLSDLVINPNQYLAITIPSGRFSLNNSSIDGVRLFFADKTLADTVAYSADAPEGKSYQKVGESWQWATPTLGAENIGTIDSPPIPVPPPTPTPPPVPVLNPKDIVLTEVYCFPGPQEDEFLEIFNKTNQSIMLSQLSVVVGASKKRLPELSLEPGQFLALEPDEIPGHLRNTGNIVSIITDSGVIIDQVEYGKSKKGESYSLSSNLIWQWTSLPTPGNSNEFVLTAATPGAVKNLPLPSAKPIAITKVKTSDDSKLLKEAAVGATTMLDDSDPTDPPNSSSSAPEGSGQSSKRKAFVYSGIVALGLGLLFAAWKLIPQNNELLEQPSSLI